MSNSAKSVLVFGVYLVCLALILLISPNTLLNLFGIPSTTEVWARVVGMLAFWLGYYYIQSARKGLTDMFRWSVQTRSTVIIFFTAFVALGFVPATLILFGVVDLLAAIWTAVCLRAESG
jgi:hypothetical protein